MGTAQYMAPERIAGGQGTPASDLYALGIVLHECLAGVPPFAGSSAEVMAAHLYLPLPPLPAAVPAEVDALVGRLTVKDPARRISDAGEFAELAARLRDALAPGLVPSAAARHYGAGAAVADPVPPPIPPSPGPQRGSGLAELAARSAPGFALGQAAGGAGHPGPEAPGQDTGFLSAEWAEPARMTTGTGLLQLHDRARRRRRAGTMAVGAAVLAGTLLAVLLISGAFRAASSDGPAPTGSASATTTLPGARPTPGNGGASSRAARTGTSAAATSPRATGRRTKASPSSSPKASPSASPSTSPSASPSASPSTSPSAGPSGTACVLGVCL
jgi:serine/threonine-protein kinase